MIFMSQSGLSDPRREKEWDAWYAEHLRIMVTVPGISSAQRFTTRSRGYSPSLAMYTVASADVFDNPYYQRVRGMGEWLPLIQTYYYRRNLFEGLDTAPDAPDNCVLIVADRQRPTELPDVRLAWLKTIGLDRSDPLTWGPRHGPQAPQRSERPGTAGALLDSRAGTISKVAPTRDVLLRRALRTLPTSP